MDIKLTYVHRQFGVADPTIAHFADDIQMRMRVEGRLRDGPLVMKLHDVSLDSDKASITVGPVSYGLQAATCFALDLPHELFEEYGGTLRDYCYARYDMDRPATNPLAICLGVSGCLIVEENGTRYLLQVTRSGHLTSLEDTVGPSAAGVVDFVEGLANLQELVDYSMAEEVHEELNLSDDEFQIEPLAWALEIFRGHRPQLFCAITTKLKRAQIKERLERIDDATREFSSYRFAPISDGRLSDDDFARLNPEARANWLFCEEWLATR
ncbi:hypothetical protein GF377_10995 [candidate division GN15 bacterium]|nr:hypothetical protein [candidate division GN15 bacterium]